MSLVTIGLILGVGLAEMFGQRAHQDDYRLADRVIVLRGRRRVQELVKHRQQAGRRLLHTDIQT